MDKLELKIKKKILEDLINFAEEAETVKMKKIIISADSDEGLKMGLEKALEQFEEVNEEENENGELKYLNKLKNKKMINC